MKINPLEWNEVDETTFEAQGLLLLRSAAPFALSIETFGVAVAVGAATSHRVPLPEVAKVTLVGGEAKVYRKDPPPRFVVSNQETFTNIDRLPQESGTMLEVTKALRLMKLEERAIVRRIREEREITNAVLAARKAEENPEEGVLDDEEAAEAPLEQAKADKAKAEKEPAK